MPRVFISYSHEEVEHNQWVMKLAADLRSNGVDAYLDKWDLIPGQDTTLFMERNIRDSDYVILVCTKKYAERSNIPQGGVGYEKNIISAEMLRTSDLRPKFIPVLRKGTYDDALPTYLGSKYGIDFRESRNHVGALDELLRAIYKQQHPDKPPLGTGPFESEIASSSTETVEEISSPVTTRQDKNIDIWEKEALERFEYLCSTKLNTEQKNPFMSGFWQASYVLYSDPDFISLKEFLEKLRKSETGRTGWDIGWVPTRDAIAPYPYKNGIEVWLAEDGNKDPDNSDFWRAETTGRFSLFRGHQEDGSEFRSRLNASEKVIDFHLVLWRISELLLYLESFSNQMAVGSSRATVKIVWNGLKERRIFSHEGIGRPYAQHICQQDEVSSTYDISSCSEIKKTLIKDVHSITTPLFEAFRFFSVTEDEIKHHIRRLFDHEKEVE